MNLIQRSTAVLLTAAAALALGAGAASAEPVLPVIGDPVGVGSPTHWPGRLTGRAPDRKSRGSPPMSGAGTAP